MADSTISQLPQALSVGPTDLIPIDQGGVTKRATLAMLGNGTVIVAPGKTLTVNNSLTLAGTDGTTMTFPATSASIARTDASQSFTGLQTFLNGVASTTGNYSGNINFTGIGNRITGDFSNPTVENLVSVQSSTTNGNTIFPILPNGTSNISALYLASSSVLTNSSLLGIYTTSGGSYIDTTRFGSGVARPLYFSVDGVEKAKIDTTGTITLGGLSATPALKVVQVSSQTNFTQLNGAATGVSPQIVFTGTDANVGATFTTKGTGGYFFETGSFAYIQLAILDTPSANHWITITGSNGGNPTIGVNAGTLATGGALVLGAAAFAATHAVRSDQLSTDNTNFPIYTTPTAWSPVIAQSGLTITQSNTGTYVKIGKQVTLTAYLSVSAVSGVGAGAVSLSGFPFITNGSGGSASAREGGVTSVGWIFDVGSAATSATMWRYDGANISPAAGYHWFVTITYITT